jgi:DNA-binding cell septation regulator SpoVG
MVTVESIKAISNAGNLRAFANINIGDNKIRIADVRVIQQDGQRPWVSMPSRAYERDGQRKWAPIVELVDESLKKEVSDVVLAEFEKLEAAPQQQRNATGW